MRVNLSNNCSIQCHLIDIQWNVISISVVLKPKVTIGVSMIHGS